MAHSAGVPGVLGWADGVDTTLDGKAPLASPAFTGTPTGITKTHVGLGSVDNTADTAKPVSTAQGVALGLKLDVTTAAATYAPVAASGGGNLSVFLGDSVTAGSDMAASEYRSVSWPTFASIISGQRIQYVRNVGIAGNTTAQMLARFDTDVTPYAPDAVFLLCGTNDVASRSLALWSQDVQAIVAKIRAIGAVPILGTLPPISTSTSKQAINQYNGWLRRYTGLQRITLLDFYTLLADPVTSNYKAAYLNDGVHPNAAGAFAMGNLAATVLTSRLPDNFPFLITDDTNGLTALSKGCFGGYTGSSLPSGWIDGAGTTGVVLSYTTDALVPGQMLTLTSTAGVLRQLTYSLYFGATTLTNSISAGATSLVIPIRADFMGVLFIGSGATFESVKILSSSGGGPQTETLVAGTKYAHAAGEQVIANGTPGDEMILSGVITSDGGINTTIRTAIPGAAYSPAAVDVLPGAITRGVVHQRFALPAGATAPMTIRLQVSAGTGVVSFGCIGFANATRLGI